MIFQIVEIAGNNLKIILKKLFYYYRRRKKEIFIRRVLKQKSKLKKKLFTITFKLTPQNFVFMIFYPMNS